MMWQFAEAVRGIARRVRRPRDAGHGRQRELLQRVRRLRDLADAGRRGAGVAPRSPPAGPSAFPEPGCPSTSSGIPSPSSAGRSSRRRCWASWRGRRRRSTWRSNAGSSTSWWRPRLPTSSPRRTTAPTGASAWRSPSARSAGPRLRGHAAGRPPGPRAPVRRVGVASRRVGVARARGLPPRPRRHARRPVPAARGDGRSSLRDRGHGGRHGRGAHRRLGGRDPAAPRRRLP